MTVGKVLRNHYKPLDSPDGLTTVMTVAGRLPQYVPYIRRRRQQNITMAVMTIRTKAPTAAPAILPDDLGKDFNNKSI